MPLTLIGNLLSRIKMIKISGSHHSNQRIDALRNQIRKDCRLFSALLITGLISWSQMSSAAPKYYGETLCQSSDYTCISVATGDTWESLFPAEQSRDIVMRVNRMNVPLHTGMKIAVPKQLDQITIYDVSPFPRYIEPTGEKMIFVNQQTLAWGAYNPEGELVWWGPISTGSGHCLSPDGTCLTPAGSFRVIRKQDIECISTVFPVRSDGNNGGALMPFCMHFLRGYALHGSDSVPGYRASHGCVRMFIEDARWLNEEFIELPGAGGLKGTRVIVNNVTG